MYHLSIFAFILVFSYGVVAQECGSLVVDFTVMPQVCSGPTYKIPPSYNTSTGGDAIANFFVHSFDSSSQPSHACASAYTVFYCASIYPRCVEFKTYIQNGSAYYIFTNSTVIPQCSQPCTDTISLCGPYKKMITDAGLPFPEDCNSYSTNTSTCMSPPQPNISQYYSDCSIPTNEELKFLPNAPASVICTPKSQVTTSANNIADAKAVFSTFRTLNEKFEFTNSMYECFKSFANFYCLRALSDCPANEEVRNIKQVCRSSCVSVITNCSEMAGNFSNLPYAVPSTSFCDSLSDTDCIYPTNDNTSLAYFFGSDPPSNIPITPSPSGSGASSGAGGSSSDEWPPGGPAKGGGIGAGVLVGLLALIGVLMLIMKKQDTR